MIKFITIDILSYLYLLILFTDLQMSPQFNNFLQCSFFQAVIESIWMHYMDGN